MPVDFFLVICLDYVLSHDIVFTEFWVQCQIFLNLDLHKPRWIYKLEIMAEKGFMVKLKHKMGKDVSFVRYKRQYFTHFSLN